MTDIMSNLKYTKTHEWVLVSDGDIVKVGITDHAQELLGDLVFIELPEIGQQLNKGKECAVVESVKAAADVYAPVSGEVIEINSHLSERPEAVNQAAYEDGWLMKIKLSNRDELEKLLTADDYHDQITTSG